MWAIVIGGCVATALIATARLLIGPTMADRIAALDVVLVSFMGAVTAWAAHTGDVTNLNLLVVVAIVGFTSTVAVTWYIDRQGDAS